MVLVSVSKRAAAASMTRCDSLVLSEVDLQILVQALGGLDVAVGQHELQARDAQVRQGVVQQRDFGHPAAALNHTAQAGPATPGQNQGKCQYGAEAQRELTADTDVSKPSVHSVTNSNGVKKRCPLDAATRCSAVGGRRADLRVSHKDDAINKA